jgi:hypothetical protein
MLVQKRLIERKTIKSSENILNANINQSNLYVVSMKIMCFWDHPSMKSLHKILVCILLQS